MNPKFSIAHKSSIGPAVRIVQANTNSIINKIVRTRRASRILISKTIIPIIFIAIANAKSIVVMMLIT